MAVSFCSCRCGDPQLTRLLQHILQMQMVLGGPLGQLQRGVSDVVSEVDVIAEDPPPPQHWTASSAELWPVRILQYMHVMCAVAVSSYEAACEAVLDRRRACSRCAYFSTYVLISYRKVLSACVRQRWITTSAKVWTVACVC